MMRTKCDGKCACGQPCDLPLRHVQIVCECAATLKDPDHLRKLTGGQAVENHRAIPLILHREANSGCFKFSVYGVTSSALSYSAADAMESLMKEAYRIRKALNNVPPGDLSAEGTQRLAWLNEFLGPEKT